VPTHITGRKRRRHAQKKFFGKISEQKKSLVVVYIKNYPATNSRVFFIDWSK